MGPKRDVVGDWQKAAKKYGLRFGVSEHLGASFTWFQASHGADKTGPMAGVPYDGADPQYQDLYHFPAKPGDRAGTATIPRWHQQWYRRDQGPGRQLPPRPALHRRRRALRQDVGPEHDRPPLQHQRRPCTAADCRSRLQLQAEDSEGRWVEDLERGVMPRIDPYPWQTDTSIGDWFYNRNWKFRPVSWVIHMLVDIVSKNGNLLLNVVQRPDGSLDPEVEQMLAELAAWNAVNGEAIYGTRPWLVYGEGAVQAKGGHFNEDYTYIGQDIRFTTKAPRSTPSRWAGPRTANWPSSRSLRLRMGKATRSSAWSCSAIKAH